MRTFILSDIHLGSRNCHAQAVLQLLDRERFDRLILNGDTVNSVNLRKLTPEHWQVLGRIRDIGKSRELILIRGNHDHEDDHRWQHTEAAVQASGGRQPPVSEEYRTSKQGAYAPRSPMHNGAFVCLQDLHPCDDCVPNGADGSMGTFNVVPALLETPMLEEYCLDAGERQYLVLHGDRFDPTLRYPVVTEMADWCYQLSQKISRKLAKWLKKKSKRWGGLLDYVRSQTVAHARERELTGIITGHTHFAEDVHVDGVHYLNSGCWTDNPCSYLVLEEGRIELRFFSS